MGATTKALYDTDFVEWSARTAELLRAGRLTEVDLEHLAEEIEDLGRSERRAIQFQLKRMLLHMLKQRIQPERDGPSWRASVADARQEIPYELAESPAFGCTWRRIYRKSTAKPRSWQESRLECHSRICRNGAHTGWSNSFRRRLDAQARRPTLQDFQFLFQHLLLR